MNIIIKRRIQLEKDQIESLEKGIRVFNLRINFIQFHQFISN